jgi:LacI family transcriptional regulator
MPKDLAVIAFTDGIISKYSTLYVSQSGKNGNQSRKMLIDRLESRRGGRSTKLSSN